LMQAADLVRRKVLSIQDIQIFERNSDYGGVWMAATYPGAACDVFSCTYQISWHRNPGAFLMIVYVAIRACPPFAPLWC
jgi:cation diffusion facilitator CzcD-associated flavoprotein CzcO